MTRLLLRHRHLTAALHVLIHRNLWWRWKYMAYCCWLGRARWAAMPADFLESIRQGQADIEAGRWYRFDTATGISTPNPDWPKDGPQPA